MSDSSSQRAKPHRARRRRREQEREAVVAELAVPATPRSSMDSPATVLPPAAKGSPPRLARATVQPPLIEEVAAVVEAVGDGSSDAAAQDAPTAREEFAAWLRQARQAKGASLEAMAQKTRIQVRVLSCLESGQFEALHADVFVRGYLRSYAQYVGLPAAEALERYAACGVAPSPVAAVRGEQAASAEVPVHSPRSATTPLSHETAAEVSVTPSNAAVAVTQAVVASVSPPSPAAIAASIARVSSAPNAASAPRKMPKPHLVIDDANPDLAERPERSRPSTSGEERFSSPFFRGDREPKQGGLTLAVIVLLVAATIALSYLMRTSAPSRGVTMSAEVARSMA